MSRTPCPLLTYIHSDVCQLGDETDFQLDESKLPQLGEIYWTETWIFGGSDPKLERPCVVVREPTSIMDLVVVITRTSDTELNALNAALAVIKWKKRCGFYLDFENEGNSTYVVDSNVIINDDRE